MRKAPWTDKECKALNNFQNNGLMVPLVCPDDKKILEAKPAGLICPVCEYMQEWAIDRSPKVEK